MKRDSGTLDLFRDFQPGEVVRRFDEERVRAASHSARLALAVKESLRDLDRADVASAISDYLGEDVSKAMLDAYASQARENHNIPAHRLVALAVVTERAELINALLAGTGLVAVAEKYEALIKREMAKEAIDRLQREATALDAQWRAGR